MKVTVHVPALAPMAPPEPRETPEHLREELIAWLVERGATPERAQRILDTEGWDE